MSKTETLEALENKYRRLLARFKDLEQQTTERQQSWQGLEREHKSNEALARELCEIILAKDSSEMVLGSEYSWNNLSMQEILFKAKESYNRYNESRTALLKQLQQQSEGRRITIENLETQIEQFINAQRDLRKEVSNLEKGQAESPVPSENLPQAEEQAEQKKTDLSVILTSNSGKQVSEKARNRVPYSIQEAASNGDLTLLPYEEDVISQISNPLAEAPPAQPGKKKTKLAIIEEDSDKITSLIEHDEVENAVLEKAANSGIMITLSARKMRSLEAVKKKTEQKIMQVDVSSIEEKLKPRNWAILEVIGSVGCCEASDIIDKALALLKERNPKDNVTASGLRHDLMGVVNNGCVTMEKTLHPLKSNFAVYSLSDIGRRLYTSHFDSDPVVSEKDLLIAQHDNLEHAFGIKALKQLMDKSGCFIEPVSMDRIPNTVKLKDGTSYIADVTGKMASRMGGFTVYMEYERGTHHQSDFNIKLNKAVKVTRFVNIVCPNSQTVENLKSKVSSWIESRGGHSRLKNTGIKVRISTLKFLSAHQKEINNDVAWQVVFNLRSSDKPIERSV